jgi:hypothetical protein
VKGEAEADAHAAHGPVAATPGGTLVEATGDGSAAHGLHLSDITGREIAVLVPLVIVILWIGIYPKPFLDRSATSIAQIGQQVQKAAPVRTTTTTTASPR